VRARALGDSGIRVSPMGLGCWAIGGPLWDDGGKPLGWGEVDDAESERAIRRALELGVTFFDTADVYGAGHSERVLGAVLSGHDQVVVGTKFGNVFDEGSRRLTATDVSPGHVRRACEASLRRLGRDRIDLYQLHVGELPDGQAAEVLDALEGLAEDGLVRAYGWSTDDPAAARLLAGRPHAAAVQHELNVLQDAGAMLAVCEQLGLASVNRTPLGMGLLTGKFRAGSRLSADDVRGDEPDWMKYFRDGRPSPEWLARLDAVREVLTSGGRTLVQGALAWIWARSDRTVPIPGFRTVRQVEENAAAMQAGPLEAGQLAEVDALLDRSTVQP
jgi:aryl-alcohol dehydrogenase-like predicted oxidoreductase